MSQNIHRLACTVKVYWLLKLCICERGLLRDGFVYMVCLYVLFIQVGGCWVSKVFKGFRFEPLLYASFKKIAGAGGCTVTGAFERFMSGCVDAGVLVFPDKGIGDFEVEARVFVDWLGKGKRFFRAEGGEEVNIQGRLLWLLPKVQDAALKVMIEEALKKSVLKQE